MKKIYIVMAAFLFLFITGCSTLTQDIEVDAEADPKANLAGYKTYAWLGSAAILYDPRGKWEPPQFDADAEIKWLIALLLAGAAAAAPKSSNSGAPSRVM